MFRKVYLAWLKDREAVWLAKIGEVHKAEGFWTKSADARDIERDLAHMERKLAEIQQKLLRLK